MYVSNNCLNIQRLYQVVNSIFIKNLPENSNKKILQNMQNSSMNALKLIRRIDFY